MTAFTCEATTGAKAAASRQDSVRREGSESGAPGRSPTAIDLLTPRRQKPLPRVGIRSLFFWVVYQYVAWARGPGVATGGCPLRLRGIYVYTYFRFWR